MAKLPSRAALAKAIEKLERDLKVATAGAAGGAVLARSATARDVALRSGLRLSPYALSVDALILRAIFNYLQCTVYDTI